MKHLKTLVPLLWANEGFPQKVNEIPESTLELATLCARIYQILFKFYEPLTESVRWEIDREVPLSSPILYIKKMYSCLVFRIYIKNITFDVSL